MNKSEIPDDWEILKLREIADVKYGKSNPPGEGNIPVVGSGGIYSTTSETYVDPPIIIIGRKGAAGNVQLFTKPCYPSDTTFYLDFKREVNPYFLYNYMNLFRLSGTHAKTTIPSIQKPDLEVLELSLPPLQEQQKIAYTLSTIQEAKEKTEAVISSLKELKKSMMKHLFTYGPVSLEGAEKVELKETDILNMPSHWKLEKLIDLAKEDKDIVGGPFGSNLKVSDYVDEGVPIIRLQNIDRNKFLNIDIKFVSEQKARELKYHSFESGDIVLAKLGDPIGKTCIVPDTLTNGIVTADVVRIRTRPEVIHKQYMVYALNATFCEQQFRMQKTGTTRPRVNVSNVRNLLVPLPPLDEQKEIADKLLAIEQKITAEQSKKDSIIQLFNSMLHNLMTAKIRVNDLKIEDAKTGS